MCTLFDFVQHMYTWVEHFMTAICRLTMKLAPNENYPLYSTLIVVSHPDLPSPGGRRPASVLQTAGRQPLGWEGLGMPSARQQWELEYSSDIKETMQVS